MEYHPFAAMFDLMESDDLDSLADDIRNNGLRVPIVIYEDKVLDGRNRSTACLMAGVKPRYEYFEGTQVQAIDFVWSANAERRQLDSSRRAAAWKKREKMVDELSKAVEAMKAEAKANQRKGGEEKVPQIVGEPSKHDRETDAKRAKMAGTNRQYMHDADVLDKEAPDLLDEVAAGKKTMPQARKELASRKPKKEKEVPKLSAVSRKAIKVALDALIRALDSAGIYGDFQRPLEKISEQLQNYKG